MEIKMTDEGLIIADQSVVLRMVDMQQIAAVLIELLKAASLRKPAVLQRDGEYSTLSLEVPAAKTTMVAVTCCRAAQNFYRHILPVILWLLEGENGYSSLMNLIARALLEKNPPLDAFATQQVIEDILRKPVEHRADLLQAVAALLQDGIQPRQQIYVEEEEEIAALESALVLNH